MKMEKIERTHHSAAALVAKKLSFSERRRRAAEKLELGSGKNAR